MSDLPRRLGRDRIALIHKAGFFHPSALGGCKMIVNKN